MFARSAGVGGDESTIHLYIHTRGLCSTVLLVWGSLRLVPVNGSMHPYNPNISDSDGDYFEFSRKQYICTVI